MGRAGELAVLIWGWLVLSCLFCGTVEGRRLLLPHSTHMSPAVGAKKPANVSQAGLLPQQEWIRVGDINNTIVSDSIMLALRYIVANCNAEGRFTYLRNLKTHANDRHKYNWLRHAGVVYALAQAREWSPAHFTPAMEAVMLRAVNYLKTNAFGPVVPPPKATQTPKAKKPHAHKHVLTPEETAERAALLEGKMLGVWSSPSTTKNVRSSCVKLGAAGLGLIALFAVETVQPGTTPVAVFQQLARFIVYMQRPDGSFHTKFPFEVEKGFVSVYYPGEAALALVLTYEKDGNIGWLAVAARALADIVKTRDGGKVADHWSIIAIARFLRHFSKLKEHQQQMTEGEFRQHALEIAANIQSDAPSFAPTSIKSGSLVKSGATTPTSTRMEGLLAALEILGTKHLSLQHHMKSQLHASIAFLLRAQIRSGPYTGAFPRSVPAQEHRKRRASEIRIDYVQHALSAMCLYHHIMFSKQHVTKAVENAAPQKPAPP